MNRQLRSAAALSRVACASVEQYRLQRRHALATLATVLALAFGAPVRAADPNEFTVAERKLFVTNHLENLPSPTEIRYTFERRGTLEPELNDRAILRLDGEATEREAKVSFLSGKESLEMPTQVDVQGNPILLYFLERELREMKRLTGGSANYFRKRIRMALAQAPQVEDRVVSFRGKPVRATEIRITPYEDDPLRARYEKYAGKRYRMLLSDAVPGAILSLESELRDGAAADAKLLLLESIRFDEQQ